MGALVPSTRVPYAGGRQVRPPAYLIECHRPEAAHGACRRGDARAGEAHGAPTLPWSEPPLLDIRGPGRFNPKPGRLSAPAANTIGPADPCHGAGAPLARTRAGVANTNRLARVPPGRAHSIAIDATRPEGTGTKQPGPCSKPFPPGTTTGDGESDIFSS